MIVLQISRRQHVIAGLNKRPNLDRLAFEIGPFEFPLTNEFAVNIERWFHWF